MKKLTNYTLQEIYLTVKDEMFPTDTAIEISDVITYVVESGYVDDDGQLIVAILFLDDKMDITHDGEVMDKQDIILALMAIGDAAKSHNIY